MRMKPELLICRAHSKIDPAARLQGNEGGVVELCHSRSSNHFAGVVVERNLSAVIDGVVRHNDQRRVRSETPRESQPTSRRESAGLKVWISTPPTYAVGEDIGASAFTEADTNRVVAVGELLFGCPRRCSCRQLRYRPVPDAAEQSASASHAVTINHTARARSRPRLKAASCNDGLIQVEASQHFVA